MPKYDLKVRLEIGTWIYAHIQQLIQAANHFRDSSLVIYACFETRNFLEKLECDIILAALTEGERAEYLPDISKMHGLNKAFGSIIEEKAHTYIQFMNALCKAKAVPFKSLGSFDFKVSNRFKTQLNEYCHIYSKTQQDLNFGSAFIQKGLNLPQRVFDELKRMGVLDDVNGITITGTPVSSLRGDSLIILERLRKKEINEADLVELLKNSKNE